MPKRRSKAIFTLLGTTSFGRLIIMRFSISIPKPNFFRFNESLWFLDRGYDDCMHVVDGGRIHKAIPGLQAPIPFELSESGDCLSLAVETELAEDVSTVRQYVTRWLELDRDMEPFYALQNELLNQLQQRFFGLRMITIPDPFEALCWSIIGQQINLPFAYRLKRRFVEQYGTLVTYEHQTLYLFPSPTVVANLTIEKLQALQFSRQKADYIISLARRIEKDNWNPSQVSAGGDTQEMSALLQELRGVGEWTANYVLMKSYDRMDSVPYGDAGLINGIKQLLHLSEKPSRARVEEVLKGTSGWEAYFVFYIWRSLAEPPLAVATP
ncbi:MAG: DNA repair protein [Bacteroidota bacterium]